jgi:predicted phosphodiesterase
MRLALLSDIHANLAALESALSAAATLGADEIVCPGDLVGYGPQPDECVRRMARAGAVTVAGNHDLIAIGRLGTERCITLARRSLEWTRSVLADDTRAFLEALPATASPADGVLVAHGTPTDPQEYVNTPGDAQAVLRDVAVAHPDVRLVVVGHTHRWMAVGETREALSIHAGEPIALDPAERVLINPGSVGQSRERTVQARFAMLDTEAWTVTFHGVDYAVDATRSALRAAGLPERSAHLYRPLPRRIAERALRAVRTRSVRRTG